MPDPLTVGLAIGPPILKGLNALTGFGKSKPSKAERKLMNMSDIFEQESTKPLTETRVFKAGMSQLDARDEKNRETINNQSAVTGSTDEAKLAKMQDSNESYNRGLQNLLQYAGREQDQNRRSYLSSLRTLESLRSNRKGRNAQKWNQVLQPLGKTGQSLWMADILGQTDKLKDAGEEISKVFDTPGGTAGWV